MSEVYEVVYEEFGNDNPMTVTEVRSYVISDSLKKVSDDIHVLAEEFEWKVISVRYVLTVVKDLTPTTEQTK